MTRSPFEADLSRRLQEVADSAPGRPTRSLSQVEGRRPGPPVRLLAAVAGIAVVAAAGLAVANLGDDDTAEIGPRAEDEAPNDTAPPDTVAAPTSLPDAGDRPDPDAILTTDDQIPALIFRIGDREWQTGGIASTWCGPDKCYDASVSIDVADPVIDWDTSLPLTIEAPFDVETIRASTTPAGQFRGSTELRLDPVPGTGNHWTVVSRSPIAPMSIGVWVDVTQEEPTGVNAVIGYGAELRPIAEEGVDHPPLLDEAEAQSTLDVRACDAGEASVLHLDDEPPGRGSLSRPWTDFAGCLARVDVITSYQGADHCGWEATEVLTVGTPLLTRMEGFPDGTRFVRDPTGAYGKPAFVDGFAAATVLPPEATQTPFFVGTAQLWTDDDAAYLVDGFAVERWPAGNPPLCA